jgi:holin-like protein
MAVALSRVTPAVVQRLQVPVQVLLYAGLFVFAEYLVGWLHLPLPANLVGMVLMLTLILCRVIPLTGCAPGRAGCWRRCCCSLFRRWWRW